MVTDPRCCSYPDGDHDAIAAVLAPCIIRPCFAAWATALLGAGVIPSVATPEAIELRRPGSRDRHRRWRQPDWALASAARVGRWSKESVEGFLARERGHGATQEADRLVGYLATKPIITPPEIS